MYQQNFGNWNYGGYQQPQPMEKVASTLTPEEMERLKKKSSQFSITLTQEEQLRGICNHRSEDGTQDTLVQDPVTGAYRCTTCGYVFHQVSSDMTAEELKKAVEQIVDILQTIKLMYLDLPVEAAREYFQIIPLIEKIPQLFEFAAKNFTKHETYNWQYYNGNANIYGMFQNLQNMFGGGFQQPMQPQMGAPMGQPVPPQQPMMGAPMMGAPMYGAPQPGANAFGFPGASDFMNAPRPGYQPQMYGGYSAPQQTTPAQPTVNIAAAPAAEQPATDSTKSDLKA